MSFHRHSGLFAALLLVCFAPLCAVAQNDDPPARHGRKYKAPPETTHLEVRVVKGFNQKPIANAAVIFHPVLDGKDEGNLEVKTNPEGKAIIDVIPIGSSVRIQVIANGFATFAEDYLVKETSREILISMARPQAQVSTYKDTAGQPSQLQPGIQEPIRPAPKTKQTLPTVQAAPVPPSAQPTSSAPPNPSTTPGPDSPPQH